MKRIKLNNKGFAITSIIYSMLILAIILISIIVLTLARKKLMYNKIRNEIIESQETYTINYYCNEGDSEPAATSIVNYNIGKNLASNICNKDNYMTENWMLTEGEEVKLFPHNYIALNLTEPGNVIDFYAYWEPIIYKINYSCNGGEGTMESSTLTINDTKNLSKNQCTKSSSAFKGWATEENGSVVFLDEEQIIFNDSLFLEDNSLNLYAVWEVVDFELGKTIYLDPTNIENRCDSLNSSSVAGTKSGCMKWYLFNESENEITLLLAHDTSSSIQFDNENQLISYINSDTNSWIGNPRLLTAEEIVSLTGISDFDKQNITGSYSLSDNFKWLYSNFSSNGYWTATKSDSTNSYVWWSVLSNGRLVCSTSNVVRLAIRPVITITKEQYQKVV